MNVRTNTDPTSRSASGRSGLARPRTLLILLMAAAPVLAQCSGNWSVRSYTSAMSGQPMVYDAAHGVCVVNGGTTGDPAATSASVTPSGPTTWTWNGSQWSLSSAAQPVPGFSRALAAMVYDSARQRTVSVGGAVNVSPSNLVQEFDGVTWTNAPTGPSARHSHAMAYDATRGETVLFGGRDVNAVNGETWVYNGTSWTQRAVTGPSPRQGVAMAFDAQRQRVVLFGGQVSATGLLADTWEWNGTAWTQVGVVGPPARSYQAVAYDSIQGRIVMFGGIGASGRLGDTWSFDGTNWTLISNAGPAPRSHAGMAFDAARNRLVLHNGWKGTSAAADTWELNGSTWARMATSGPPQRTNSAMVFASGIGRALMFGGYQNLLITTSDTWTYDGTNWETLPGGPSARYNHALSYDPVRNRTVLYGGRGTSPILYPSDTWETDGLTWTQIPTAGGPGPRVQAAMAYDPITSRTMLFGGSSTTGVDQAFGDTWQWDGTGWTLVTLAGPAPRLDAKMAYDPIRARLVLFGGWARLGPTTWRHMDDTWEWDGAAWTMVSPSGPGPRAGFTLVWHAGLGRIVLQGGQRYDSVNGSTGIADDLWTWDGSTWRQLVQSGGENRFAHVAAYDPARNRIVMLGGATIPGTSFADRVYEFAIDAQATDRPPELTGPTTAGVSGFVGQPATITLGQVASTTPVTIQWTKNGLPLSDGGSISGAQSTTLLINPFDLQSPGIYSATVANGCAVGSGPVVHLVACATQPLTLTGSNPQSLSAYGGERLELFGTGFLQTDVVQSPTLSSLMSFPVTNVSANTLTVQTIQPANPPTIIGLHAWVNVSDGCGQSAQALSLPYRPIVLGRYGPTNLGSQFSVDLYGEPNLPVLILVDFAPGVMPLAPYGTAGLAFSSAMFPLIDSLGIFTGVPSPTDHIDITGKWETNVTIPQIPALVGVSVYLQGFTPVVYGSPAALVNLYISDVVPFTITP